MLQGDHPLSGSVPNWYQNPQTSVGRFELILRTYLALNSCLTNQYENFRWCRVASNNALILS